MTSLESELNRSAAALVRAAASENQTVRNRIRKLADEMNGLRSFVRNDAEFKDFVPDGFDFSDIRSHKFQKRTCSVCGCDLTVRGGWVFPQSPDKLYCTSCEMKTKEYND